MSNNLKPLAVLAILTVIFGTVYGAGQHILRLSANDPQIQLAEDAAASLDHGAQTLSVITPKIDVNKSLAPFVEVYDKQGNLISTAVFNGPAQLKPIDVGVLKHSDSKPYYPITWQPETNVRIASVSVAAHDYYVVSGRSLTEVEARESSLMWLVALGWALSVAVLGGYYVAKNNRKLNKK